jgi:hypothetical protein
MPVTFRTVADYLAASSRPHEVEALRSIVVEANPRLVETIKWNSPSYVLDGVDRLTINAAGRGPVRLILHLGTETPEDRGAVSSFAGDPGGLLTWHSNIRASMVAGPDRDAAIAVVRAWLSYGPTST